MLFDQEPDGATGLEPEERECLKHKHVTTRAQLDHLEQANIQEGLSWLSRRRKREVLDDMFVRELHRRLFGQVWTWAGNYRLTEKNICIDPRQISVQLKNLLDDAKYWADHKTYPPLEACMRFHHRLVCIHLFPNRNGRHARIMTDVLMSEIYNGEPIDWEGRHQLQSMDERRVAYIQALRLADKGDYNGLLKFAGQH